MAGGTARVTGGEFSGRVIRVPGRTPAGFRPSAGRLREAVFNILGNAVAGCRFLDLFAGSGIIGFEALSRGAAHATFVESSRSLCDAIRTTARELSVVGRSEVLQATLPVPTGRLHGPFDIAYLDPPYAMQDVETTFASLVPLLSSTARVVYEHSSRYDPPEHPPGLELEQRRVYGDSAIALYCSSESE